MSAREELLHKIFTGSGGDVGAPVFEYKSERPIPPLLTINELFSDASQWRISRERRAQARLETHFGMLSR